MKEHSSITVDAGRKLYPTGDLYGIFFEDINHAADGGLYAEMVRNRSFEFCEVDNKEYTPLTAWELIGRDGGEPQGGVEAVYPLNVNNTHYLRLTNAKRTGLEVTGTVGAVNCGYNTGLPLRAGKRYIFSMFARRDVCLSETVEARLESADGRLYGKCELVIDSTEWKKYEAAVTSEAEDFSGRLVILIHGAGSVCLDMVSLFPEETFCGRKNGLRPDIAQMLAELKPKFMRFPGGCLTHDGDVDEHARDAMYRWRNSVGPLEARPSKRDNWGYNQTYGFGYYEFFLFCEDIGAKPMPVLPGAFNPHRQYWVPMEEMQPWVDEALELLEFANGSADTRWGRVRAEMGHPEPFGVEYIAIGNEEVDEGFFERYPLFHKAIAEKYPDVKILNTAGPAPAGKGFDLGWESARRWGSYGVDEHYYVAPDWMIENYGRYFSDFYDPNGPKVFLGEYASRNNTFYNALCEAAYMTSFELNADKVALTCYAPLLCNADYVNWRPNMIWYDNHRVFGIPSYYVQKMYSVNQGDVTLDVKTDVTDGDKDYEPERIHGGIAFGVGRGQVAFRGIRINGQELSGADLDVRNGDWSYRDGGLTRGPLPAPAEGEHPWRRFGPPRDVVVNGDYENLEFECTLTVNEPVIELPPRHPGGEPVRFRRGVSIAFCVGDDAEFSWNLGGGRADESIIGCRLRGYDSRLSNEPFKFENEREYKLTLVRRGNRITAMIDGKAVNDVEYKPVAPERIYVSSTLDEDAGEVIIKAVNVRPSPVTMTINVEGAGKGARTVKLETLTADSIEDTNTFEEPERVATKYSSFEVGGVPFEYDFAPRSVNIFRIPILK